MKNYTTRAPIAPKKTLSLLTLLAFLLCSLSAQSSINESQSIRDVRMTLSLRNAPLKEVLTNIQKKSDFRFVYNDQVVNNYLNITLNERSQTIAKILDAALKNTNLYYEDENKKILILEKINPVKPDNPVRLPNKQTGLGGKVTDESGAPLPGVSVMLKEDSKIITSTNENGAFNLNVPDNLAETGTLVFTFISFRRQEVPIGNQRTFTIKLLPDVKLLNEVVVVGYGTQSKRNVSTAIATVRGEALADLPVSNPTQALVGQVSGVLLQQTSGAPGEAPVVRIRGNGSITSGNGPLYVIDGYPTNDASLINSISPQDIESMDILKDAASAAIYGSRAGNGVIIVTTKRGKTGKTKFSFDAITGFENIMQKYGLLNSAEFVEMAKEGLTNQNRAIPDFLNQPERWANTDWQDIIFRTAPFQNYQISANGGTDKVQFAISGGLVDQQGILENTYMKRYNIRGSLDAKLTEKVKVGLNVQPSFTQRRVQQTTGGNTSTGVDGILAEALTMPPILPVWRDNGDYFVIVQDAEMKTIFNDELSNPLIKLDANKDIFYTFRQTGNTYIEYKPIKGLRLNSTLNIGLVSEKEEWFVEPFLARGNGNTGNISTPNLAQIRARRNNVTNLNWYWSNTATYDFSLKGNHNFTALLGYDAAKQSDFYVTLQPRTDRDNPVAFVNANVKNVQGAVLTQGTSERKEYVFDAVFARLNYNYNSKYLLSASIRRDRSSRFGPNNRAGIFPSVSAGWNISEEPFIKDNSTISMLKLRASYGETGNDQLAGYYPWITTMQREYYVFGTTDAQVVAYRPGGFSNADLGWEKNKQVDVGLDIGLLKGRIDLSLDFYNRNSNIILNADLPSLNGKAESVIQNVGNVRNRGVEFSFNSLNFNSAFRWSTIFNISFNRNKLVRLASGQTQLNNQGVVRNYVGRPMGDLYMYIVEGTFNNDDDLAKYPKLGSQGIGDLRYRDVSGPDGVPDGVINANDQTHVGNYQPDFVYGLGNTFSFKNFDLNVLLDGTHGSEIFRSQELPLGLSRWLENGSKESLGRWRSEDNPGNGRYHRAGSTNLSSNITSSTRYLYDGSFLRIRNVTLGYSLSAKTLNKLGIQHLRMYVAGQNLLMFSKVEGFGNPQGNGSGDNATNNGVETGTYPLARNISLGLNLTF